MTGRLLGREPVATVSTVVALLIAILPAFGWSTEVVGTVAAALVLIGGAVEAALVSVDRVLPLLVGVGKAVLAAVASFGIALPDNYVAAVMAVLTVIAGLVTRAQVGAVQPPVDRQGREIDRSGWPVGVLDTASSREVYERNEGLTSDAPPLPETGAHAHTEVFGVVAADGPVPGDYGAERERGHQPRHAYRGQYGRLNPDLG